MSQTWEMEYVKMYVFFFVVAVRNARNKRNGNAAEIEKEKHILQPLVSDYIRSIV